MKADSGTTTKAGRTARPAEVRVWDPLVRVFHWGLVGVFAIAWATGDESKTIHLYAGYIVMGLIAFRILWGLVGTRHARFSDFVYHPSTVVGYLKDMLVRRSRRYIGHNPAGGAMVIALLVTVAAISATGFMMTTDAYWGVAWVEELHETTVNLALALVGLHVLGVIFASFEHGENLVRAMVTGRKRER
jgi:cytochrome b